MQARLTTAVLLGFTLVGAAACGGGSDGLNTAQEEELRQEVEAAETEAAEARRRAEAAEAARLAAEAARREAEQAAEEEAEEQRQAAEQAQREAEEAERARQAAEAERQEIQQQLTEAEQAELRARATSLNTAFGAGDAALSSAPATVTWPRGGSLTFRPAGVTHAPGSAAPSVPGGWRSAGFTGQTGTAATLVEETVYLYTNIQAPGTRAFWKKYGGDDLDITQQQVTDGLVNPSASVSRTRQDPSDSTSPYVSATTGGTYDGVSGRFSCTGDETVCTVTRTDGTTTIAGTWTFKATNLGSGAPVNQDDAFLYFGIWSSIPDNIAGTGYNFRHVAGGGAATGSDLSGFAALTGSATFRGGAVGSYVTQGQVGGQNARIGTFTATATLNADFGAADTPGTLSGRITDFREGGNPLSGWSVTLGSDGNVGAASTIALTASGTDDVGGDTVANIGGLSVGGSWGASFYGSANTVTGLDDRQKYPAVDLAGVAGWFKAIGANANDASLAGAFAATPQ